MTLLETLEKDILRCNNRISVITVEKKVLDREYELICDKEYELKAYRDQLLAEAEAKGE